MSTEESKALILRYFTTGPSLETIKRIRESKEPIQEVAKFFKSHFESIFSDDFICHDTTGDWNKERTLQENIALMSGFRGARFGFDKMVAEGDLVAVVGKMTGNHQGSYKGIPPTGKNIELKYAILYRVATGKVVEAWSNMDWFGLMQQIGAIPDTTPKK